MEARLRLYTLGVDGARRLEVPAHASDPSEVLSHWTPGVYTALRTYGGARFFGLAEHLERLDRSIELSGWSERLDRELVRRGLQQVADEWPGGSDAKIRFDVLPPTPEARTLVDGRMLIVLMPFEPVPAEIRARGVRVDVARELHRTSPRVKRAAFALERQPYPLNRRDCYDHLMLDDRGRVLEATSANVFARIDDTLRTADEGVLEGITRRFVLACAARLGFEVRLDPFRLDELASAQEAFLSSSTRGVVPIVEVESRCIADGAPGPWTKALHRALEEEIERLACPAWPVEARA